MTDDMVDVWFECPNCGENLMDNLIIIDGAEEFLPDCADKAKEIYCTKCETSYDSNIRKVYEDSGNKKGKVQAI